MALLLVAASAPALAQDQDSDQISESSRAALLAAERDRKATESVPPQRGRIDRLPRRAPDGPHAHARL